MTRRFWTNVFAVAYKEGAVMRHDKAFLSLVLAQPVMMFLLMGFALSNDPRNVTWAVWDQRPTSLSRALVTDVLATGDFLEPVHVESTAAGRELLRRGKALVFLVIPQSFRRDLERGRGSVQLLLDGSDPLAAARVGATVQRVAGAILSAGSRLEPLPLTVRQRFWFNATLDDNLFFLSALAGMLLTNFCLSAPSLGLVAERENGTFEQMLSLPMTAVEIVIGKLVPYAIVGFGLTLYATVLSGLFFDLWPEGGMIPLLIVTAPFILSSLSIGVFISALARTTAQAVFITVFFILPSFVLSGVLLPYQLMPPGIREIGGLTPLRWYQIASRQVIEHGAGISDVWLSIVAMSAIFAALLLGVRIFMKSRLG